MTTFIISFVVWAVLHSVTAARRSKKWVQRQWGERAYTGLYRLFYNVFALITFLPVLYFTATELPDTRLWIIPEPWSWLTGAIQLGALIALFVSLWQTDIWEFVGLRQFWRYLQNESELTVPPRLVTTGPYAWVRHPLYFFSMVFLWLNPLMVFQTFLFNLFVTLYFWAGSRVEERRLADFFGEAYTEYRQQVPGLIPVKLPRRHRVQ